MSNFLKQVITAHGGLERWNKFNKVSATIVSGGAKTSCCVATTTPSTSLADSPLHNTSPITWRSKDCISPPCAGLIYAGLT